MAKQFTPEMEKQLVEMRKKGWTAQKVADALGIAKSTAAGRMALLPKPCSPEKAEERLTSGSIIFKPHAKVVMPAGIKVQRHVSTFPEYAPICATSMQGRYTGAGLAYRGQAKR